MFVKGWLLLTRKDGSALIGEWLQLTRQHGYIYILGRLLFKRHNATLCYLVYCSHRTNVFTFVIINCNHPPTNAYPAQQLYEAYFMHDTRRKYVHVCIRTKLTSRLHIYMPYTTLRIPFILKCNLEIVHIPNCMEHINVYACT